MPSNSLLSVLEEKSTQRLLGFYSANGNWRGYAQAEAEKAAHPLEWWQRAAYMLPTAPFSPFHFSLLVCAEAEQQAQQKWPKAELVCVF